MPTDSEPNFLYTAVTAIISLVAGVFTGSIWVNKAQAKKYDTDAEIALRKHESESKKELIEENINLRKDNISLTNELTSLHGQIKDMKIDFAKKSDDLLEKLDLITRKYNLQVILNSSTKN